VAIDQVITDIHTNTDHPIMVRHSITLVSGVQEYILPPQVGELIRIAKITSSSSLPEYEIWPGSYQNPGGHGWKLEGNLNAARVGMVSLAQLIQLERDKEISDGDPNLSKNFGFCGESALQIDVGRFGKEASLASSKEDLQHFINANLPELSDFFDSLFQPLIDSHESAPVLSDR
nr:hypothetical protein [Chlamydiota bacterium]